MSRNREVKIYTLSKKSIKTKLRYIKSMKYYLIKKTDICDGYYDLLCFFLSNIIPTCNSRNVFYWTTTVSPRRYCKYPIHDLMARNNGVSTRMVWLIFLLSSKSSTIIVNHSSDTRWFYEVAIKVFAYCDRLLFQ